MAHTFIEDAVCPACDGRGMEYRAEPIDLPFMGTSLETMLRCNECGYRHTDFILTETKEPTRHVYRVQAESDMSVRVVRSASGTIRIPELGVEIEPGAASEAFISNVEGILVRIEAVLDQLHRDADTDEVLARIESLQETLDKMRLGTAQPVTLIIEDPFGNSAILGEGVRVERMSPEEAENLKAGFHIFAPEELGMGKAGEGAEVTGAGAPAP